MSEYPEYDPTPIAKQNFKKSTRASEERSG